MSLSTSESVSSYHWSALLCVCVGADPGDWHSPTPIADTWSAFLSVDLGSRIKLRGLPSTGISSHTKTWPSHIVPCRATSDQSPRGGYVAAGSGVSAWMQGLLLIYTQNVHVFSLRHSDKEDVQATARNVPPVGNMKSASNWLAAAWWYGTCVAKV